MRVPFSWIKEFVDFDWSARELADKLTFSGLEVEEIATVGSDYAGISVAEIKAVKPHPDADNLTLCDVNAGHGTLTVVCGAKNFKPGDKAPFAGIGAVLPNGMKIKKAKIRGQVSEGMLCAEDELGISDNHSGIMILPPETNTGAALSEVIGGPEQVFVIEVTPNRPDCLSIIGIAREIAALCGSRLKLPTAQAEQTDQSFSVRVDDSDGCPRYTARPISGVTIAPSPAFISRRLVQCGVRPINNVVDITNYVMLETGQPLHAFDQRFLEGSAIIVRRAKKGETITSLDGIERKLDENILVIANSAKPVAIAGIMGGEHSGVLDDSTEILLESACFDPGLIRKGSKSIGLSSESSYRFERGVDPNIAGWAGKRAAALIAEHCGGALQGLTDIFKEQPKPGKITLRYKYLKSLLGVDMGLRKAVDIFKALELEVSGETEDTCVVSPPSFRLDLENEADLCEEAARIYGLDQIPMPAPRSVIVPDADDSEFTTEMDYRSFLAGSGLNEIMNYSFISGRMLDMFCPEKSENRVILPNPVSADHSFLRNSLIPQMVETLGRNRARQIQKAGLFETGRIFFKDAESRLCEENRLSIGLMGAVGRIGLTGNKEPDSEQILLWLKGILERLCVFAGIKAGTSGMARKNILKFEPIGSNPASSQWLLNAFDKNAGFTINIDGSFCGVAGVVRADLRAEWRFTDPIATLEMTLAPLLKKRFSTPQAQELPAYPAVQRDVALIAPEHVTHQEIIKAAEKFAQKELTNIELFDIYRSVEIGVGMKSLAYSFTYRSLNRTLTDEEVNDIHSRVRNGIEKLLPVRIR